MPAPLIRLDGVGLRHANGLQALEGVDLALARGEFVSLLGPSGCGKSTLLRLLAGLARPTSGRLHRPEAAGADDHTGVVFQEPTLMPWASVHDNVALPLKLQRWPRERIAVAVPTALAAVGLADFARALPRELSGGMKMRVSIARALVTRPTLLLLDEPFAALDEITRFRLNQDLLSLWRPDGAAEPAFTAVFVTHSVYEAVFLSRRVLVMAARPGRIVAALDIDEPHPRGPAFRRSERYARWCAEAGEALEAASAVHPNG
ncbi:ABC transporter ATP-binding protein [Aquabacterium sp. J223]|uniref:ABC transporter ATP-binding protein n=1 Tax=Aquabacterium sp. J223 TaxID=2898431 RepID=UPI0021ADC679|nr:ATP-binding cassette domain-containing protein [Aquabacterium sp. J223]UUX94850.1 ATP-binding cassette domain-containing protein [Aquabacterium sp. J223]